MDAQSRLHAAIERGDRTTASSLLAPNFSSCDVSEDRPLARDEWLDVAIGLRLRWRAFDEVEVSDTTVGLTVVSGLFSVASRGASPGVERVIDLWGRRQAAWLLVVRRERPIPVYPSIGP